MQANAPMNSSEPATAEVASEVGTERRAADRERDQAHRPGRRRRAPGRGSEHRAARQVCTPDPVTCQRDATQAISGAVAVSRCTSSVERRLGLVLTEVDLDHMSGAIDEHGRRHRLDPGEPVETGSRALVAGVADRVTARNERAFEALSLVSTPRNATLRPYRAAAAPKSENSLRHAGHHDAQALITTG